MVKSLRVFIALSAVQNVIHFKYFNSCTHIINWAASRNTQFVSVVSEFFSLVREKIKAFSGALACARSGVPWITKFGKLSIRENLVVT